MMLYLAHLDTDHYTWRALGTTEQEARDLVRAAFLEWMSDEWDAALSWELYADGVNVYPLAPGMALRDDSVMVPAQPATPPNTSPAESPDITATVDVADLLALVQGRPVHVEGWSSDDPHGMPAAIVRLTPSGE